MTNRVRPYLFYDVALTICSKCFRKLEGKIVFQDDKVFLLKRCPEHGAERVLIADDVDYYRRCREVFVKKPEMPMVYNTPVKWGCPYDCGLCTDHEQHSCLSLVELTDSCNLRCPVCYAGSGPERTEHRSLALIEKMLDAVVRNEGHPDVVQISGGEPTLHPDFFTIVRMAKTRPIRHLMVNTNGLKIAQDEDFVKRLAEIAGLRGLPAIRFVRARSAARSARRRPAQHSRTRHRTAEQTQHFNNAGGHSAQRPERRRNRQDHRLRAAAALCARRHFAADSGRRASGTLRSGNGPAYANRSAPQNSRTDQHIPPRRRDSRTVSPGLAGDGLCAKN